MSTPPFKYTVITYAIGENPIIRIPFVDNEVDYVLISDRNRENISPYRLVILDNLLDEDKRCVEIYIRYHASEYSSTEVVVLVSPETQIIGSLDSVIKKFNETSRDILLVVSNHSDPAKSLSRNLKDGLITKEEYYGAASLLNELCGNLAGGIDTSFMVFRSNHTTLNLFLSTWRYLLACRPERNIPNRADDVIFHAIFSVFFTYIKSVIISPQIFQTRILQFYNTDSYTLSDKGKCDYDEQYYLSGRPCSPVRIGDPGIYPTSYRYNTEAILLLRYLSINDLIDWLNWHLYKCDCGYEMDRDIHSARVVLMIGSSKRAECLEQASPELSPLPNCNPIASRQGSVMMARQEAHVL